MPLRRILLSLTCAAVLAALPSAAQADTFAVNTTADVTGGCPATCSLRAAFAGANASAGDDTITVPAGTYTLSMGQLTSNGGVTVTGAGSRSTIINGAGASRVLELTPSGTAATTLASLTITGGASKLTDPGATSPGDGGAILFSTSDANPTITLDRVRLTGNTAEMSGGALAAPPESNAVNAGHVFVRGSTIDGNKVNSTTNGQGGGLSTFGALDLVNSTVTGNSAAGGVTSQGGGVLAGSSNPATAGTTLINSTIAKNVAQGPASVGTGAGGISGTGMPLDATNSIVANNTLNGATSDCGALLPGTIANDLSSDASCGFTTANGGKPNTEPQLGSLGDHGGPTDTLGLPATSPAVDAGTAAGCPGTDQRGVTRPVGPACDMGAVENAAPTVGTAPPANIGTNDASLRATVRNPFVNAAIVTFQYGRTTGYGSTASAAPVAAGISTPVSAQVSKLTSGASYQYRAVVINGDGLVAGPNQGFNTLAAGKKPYLKVTGTPKVCRKTTFELRIRTRVSGQGVTFGGARVLRDGKSAKLNKKVGRFRVKINSAKLKPGRHAILVRARDSKNRLTLFRKSFSRCKAAPAKRKKKG